MSAVQVDRFCHEALLYAGQEEFLKGVVPFLRQRQGRHERLVSLEGAAGPLVEEARQRVAAIFGDRTGGQAAQESLYKTRQGP